MVSECLPESRFTFATSTSSEVRWRVALCAGNASQVTQPGQLVFGLARTEQAGREREIIEHNYICITNYAWLYIICIILIFPRFYTHFTILFGALPTVAHWGLSLLRLLYATDLLFTFVWGTGWVDLVKCAIGLRVTVFWTHRLSLGESEPDHGYCRESYAIDTTLQILVKFLWPGYFFRYMGICQLNNLSNIK